MALQVETQYGTVEGVRRRAHVAFKGIPYAKPPVGKLRFAAPEPPEPWLGVRAAREFGASAMQGLSFAPGTVAEGPTSEDCLYLNVYTPAADGNKRPVMFWIHGGAFTVGTGSAAVYDGGPLVERADVVVVTINYRLGLWGYLPFGEAGTRWGAADNRGQRDQIAALHWVQANIERFGGDPKNVTIFGESAGGTAVTFLLATPSAKGLFARAIVQSGTCPLQLPSAERNGRTRRALLDVLGFGAEEGERLLDASAADLATAQNKVELDRSGWPHFSPVFDGTLLPEQPAALLASGQGSKVPLILGANRDEWNLFVAASIAEWNAPQNDSEAIRSIERKLPASAAGAAAQLFESYKSSRRERGLPHGTRAIVRAIEGDLRFRIPTLRFAEFHQALERQTYHYLFSYESPALRGALGACHALELPFVFGTYDAANQEAFAGRGEGVATLSRTMIEAWTSFAHGRAPVAHQFDVWPRYELGQRPTLEFNTESKVVSDPYGEERRAWEGVI